MAIWTFVGKGLGRKISRGANGKKGQKLAKIPKNSTICFFQGGPTEKRPTNSKKGRK